ncbi:MAG: ABC transporter ATP-binding protein [Clostridia bacterium]|nr:ABC transporter ATP-binding protein [Clostridia bacterium]
MMTDSKKDRPSAGIVLKNIFRLYGLTREYFFKYGIFRWFGGIASGGLEVFFSYLMGRMVGVALTGDIKELVRYAAIIISATIIRTILGLVNEYSHSYYSIHSGKKLREMAMEKINDLPIAYYENQHTGESISRFASDIEKIQSFYGNTIAGIWSWVPASFAFSLAILLKTNWELTLICGTVIPVFLIIMNKISIPIGEASQERQEHAAEYNSYLRDFTEGIHIYKSFGMYDNHGKKFKDACGKYAEASFKMAKRRAFSIGLMILGMILPQIVALGVGSLYVINGKLAIEELFVFTSVLWPFVSIFRRVSESWSDLIEEYGRAKHLFILLYSESERTTGEDLTDLSKEIVMEFRNVGFSYTDSTEVLKSTSFTVEKGKKTALVGISGSGKSTVHKIFSGHYDNYSGEVVFMGSELSRWKLASLRSNIAAVNQEIYLFNDNVLENIRYGRPAATDEEVMDAARKAYAHEFIIELEDGYGTMLGERGTGLSGGQRQRIAVARALLKDSPVILLDEPTSALDTRAEFHVQKAIERLEEGRTVFIIAHRLSTIENADKIVVLEEGKVVGTGSHFELIDSNETYRQLYSRQVMESKGEPA